MHEITKNFKHLSELGYSQYKIGRLTGLDQSTVCRIQKGIIPGIVINYEKAITESKKEIKKALKRGRQHD